jgi:iron complex transport system ATP-binding protein
MSMALRIAGLTVAFGQHRVLTDIDLEVEDGAWLALLGTNGAGKTTLVRAIGGTVRHTGSIEFSGASATRRSRTRARRVAIVPQTPIIPTGVTVFEYVLLGRSPHQGVRLAASLEDRRRTLAVLQRLDLERFLDRTLTTLSGGERQRVVLARALVADAPVLVLDEPTAALDLGHQFEILELLAELQQEQGLTVITTLHDLSVAGQFGDRLAVLHEGRMVAHGSPSEVLTPERIGRYWGVAVSCETDGEGRVTVNLHRRREQRHAERTPEVPAPSHENGTLTTDPAGSTSGVPVTARGEGFEPPAA